MRRYNNVPSHVYPPTHDMWEAGASLQSNFSCSAPVYAGIGNGRCTEPSNLQEYFPRFDSTSALFGSSGPIVPPDATTGATTMPRGMDAA